MQRFGAFSLAVIVSLLIVVAGLLHALKQHPPYAPKVNTDQQAHGALKGEEKAQASEHSPAKPNEEHGRKDVEQREEDGTEFWPSFLGLRLKITDSLIAGFTLGLLIFTGLLWRSTDKLWLAGEKQLRLLAETSEAQSREMQASIAEAKKSADAAMLAVGSDRAWMTLDEPMIMPVNNATIDGVQHRNGFMFAAWWKNMGRSPATHAEIASDHCLVPIDDINEPPSFIPRWYKEPGAGSTVGPNARVRSLPRAVGAQERQLIEDGSMAIILFAEVRYRDTFNPGTLHTTTVCLRFEYNGLIRDERTGAETPRWEITAIGPQNRIT